jgi:hypothetical protein
MVFGDDGGASQLGAVTGSVDDGYVVKLPVRVDPRPNRASLSVDLRDPDARARRHVVIGTRAPA